MGRIHYQLKKRLYRLKAYRRKGFGVHSPFVFHLITNVIEVKLAYYAFHELSAYRKKVLSILKTELKNKISEKVVAAKYTNEMQFVKSSEAMDRLQFRLLNFWHSKQAAYFGSGIGFSLSYLAKVDSRVNISWFDRGEYFTRNSDELLKNQLGIRNYQEVEYESFSTENSEFDFVVFSANTNPLVLDDMIKNKHRFLNRKCMVLVQNPHKNETIELFWKKMKQAEDFSVSLDLFHLGILIAREGMFKQDYVRKYRF